MKIRNSGKMRLAMIAIADIQLAGGGGTHCACGVVVKSSRDDSAI